MPFPSDFSKWVLEDARNAITLAITAVMASDEYEDNRTYIVDRDGWGAGRFWMGPNGGSDLTVRTRVLAGVERQHIHVDTINECLHRVANSLLRKEADVSFAALEPAPEDSEAAEAQAAEADAMLDAISALWDREKLWEKARQAVIRARGFGRGALRWWLPPGLLVPVEAEGKTLITLPKGLEIVDAFAKIYLSAPEPDECTVYTDAATQQQAAVFVYADDDDKVKAELWFVDSESEETVVRTIGEGEASEFRIPLGGRLPIVEMSADLLITESVRRQQARLNFFESLLVRVGETAGFPERYIGNSKPQGVYLTSIPEGPPLEDPIIVASTTYYLHAVPRTLGAAVTTELRGFEYDTDDNGGKGLTTPSVQRFEPTDPDYAIKAAWHARRTILEQCKQGHVLTNTEAAPSGYSREQARADYEDDLANTKTPLEGMLRDIIESAIALAESMGAGGESFLARYRCVVNLHVDSGPMSPEEKQQIALQVEKGLLSRPSAMAQLGSEDTASELERIEQDPSNKLDLAKRQGEAMAGLTAAGFPLFLAAKAVGFDDETVAELKRVADFAFPEDEPDEEIPTNGNGAVASRIPAVA